jgi:hypothetical protein
MRLLKKTLKTFLSYFGLLEAARKYFNLCIKDCNFEKKPFKLLLALIRNIKKVKFIAVRNQDYNLLIEAVLFKEMCKKARLTMKEEEETFFYYPDFFILPIYKIPTNLLTIGNITVNYAEVLNKGILGLEEELKQLYLNNELEETFYLALLEICEGIKIYSNRVKYFVDKKFPNKSELINCLERVPFLPAQSFF